MLAGGMVKAVGVGGGRGVLLAGSEIEADDNDEEHDCRI